MVPSDIARELERIDTLLEGVTSFAHPPAELDAGLDELLNACFELDAATRDVLVRSLRARPRVLDYLFCYVQRTAKRLFATGDSQWLRRAAIGLAIEDVHVDPRDWHANASDVWDAAKAVGLDPAVAFRDAARVIGSATLARRASA